MSEIPGTRTVEAPLRAGLSACGGIAPLTLVAAGRSPDFDVVAIQDPDPDALRRTGERFGIERRHRDFDDLLTADIDFVVINTPNHLHLSQVRAAAAAGKACLVQKPMAPTLLEACEMVEAAAAAEVRLGVTMFELGKPIHHQVKAMVQSGWIGAPTLVQATSAHGIYLRDPPPLDDWRRDPGKVGGAAFIQLAVHHVNLVAWILEREAAAISVLSTHDHTPFEDETTLATVRFADGPLAHFAASYATDLYGLTVCGTRGRIHLLPEHVLVRGEAPFSGRIFRYSEPGREVAFPLADLEEAVDRHLDAVEVHGAFARWLDGRGAFPCTGERGLADMRVVDAAYRSLMEGRCVSL